MGDVIHFIPTLLIETIIFIVGLFSGMKTYLMLKEYIDMTLKIQRTDNKKEIEEYGIEMATISSQLIPWVIVYVLCIVLFIIILYALTT